ncbi:uncharacterized protein EDB91DRAFT_1142933 [Suillus paluster]|uniref:uncharacterized protein n=1 Tax=Suillus paluster TaxID=48578 RepID=UPI001B8729D8|nr:uncharacterized protein EDB91DRAFT_1142933 [Suillus paluster]KAG1736120.1 hypothetical protein EDB91DRAFT_1142933 [Suillus paluster]
MQALKYLYDVKPQSPSPSGSLQIASNSLQHPCLPSPYTRLHSTSAFVCMFLLVSACHHSILLVCTCFHMPPLICVCLHCSQYMGGYYICLCMYVLACICTLTCSHRHRRKFSARAAACLSPSPGFGLA